MPQRMSVWPVAIQTLPEGIAIIAVRSMGFGSQIAAPEHRAPAAARQPQHRCHLADLDDRIQTAAEAVEAAVGENEDAKLLTSIPGISYLSALTIMAEIGTIDRFESAKKLMSYAGLVPSTYSSGSVTRHGGIVKTGSIYLRFVRVEAAHHQVNAKKMNAPCDVICCAPRIEIIREQRAHPSPCRSLMLANIVCDTSANCMTPVSVAHSQPCV